MLVGNLCACCDRISCDNRMRPINVKFDFGHYSVRNFVRIFGICEGGRTSYGNTSDGRSVPSRVFRSVKPLFADFRRLNYEFDSYRVFIPRRVLGRNAGDLPLSDSSHPIGSLRNTPPPNYDVIDRIPRHNSSAPTAACPNCRV